MGNFNMGHNHGGLNNKPVAKEEEKSTYTKPDYPVKEVVEKKEKVVEDKKIIGEIEQKVKEIKVALALKPVISKKEIVKKVQVKEVPKKVEVKKQIKTKKRSNY